MANTTVKGKFNVVAENGDVQTIYPKTTGDQVLVDRSSNASVIPNDVANLQHIVNKMGSLALKSKVETSDFTTGTMISSLEDLKSNTDTGKIADATVVKAIESRVDTLENSNLVTVDELDAGLATKPDTEINDSVTSTSLTWSSKKLSDQLTTLNSNTSVLTSRVNNIITHNNDTEGNSELIDIRKGADGTTYETAGDAVRGQFQKHEYFLNDLADYNYTSSTTTVSHDNIYQGTIIKSDGTLQTNEYTTRFVVKKYENVSKGKYKAHGFPQNNNCLYIIVSPGDTVIEYQKIDDTLPSGTTDYDFYVLYDRCTVYVGGFDTISPMLYQYYKILSLNEEVHIPQIENNQNTLNPLYQKIVTLNGDSIANGAGCMVDGQHWGFMDFIAERNSMTLDKQAVNGGCLSVKTSEQAGRHYICNTVEDMNVNADYVLFEGGYNDYYLWHILGAITETMTNEVDNTTVYGALESICRQSLERWHTAKIGFIITHKINTAWRAVHDNSSTEHVALEDYYQAIRDVCEKYSIPYLDLSKVSRLNTELQSYKTFTYNSDGIHPTQQGYETFYVPLIEEWMKKL